MTLLYDIILILAFSLVVIIITTKLKIPPLTGFLLTGIIIGPPILGLVKNLSEIEILAEIGIMLLMFSIGLEFSLEKIKFMRKNFIFFGGLQVLLSWLLFTFILTLFDLSWLQSFFGGFILTLSSTAIVLKTLTDKGKLSTPYGLKITGILLFQDASLIPFLILMPSFFSAQDSLSSSILINILISLGGITALIVLGRLLLPSFFNIVLDLRLPEIFMVTLVVTIFGIAFAAYSLGASLAMGAFIAGVAISDTDHAHHVNTELIPSKHLFNSIFFISIGMFINLQFVASNILTILLITAGIIALKAIVILLIFILSKHSISEGIMAALGLAHIGEFSFILLKLSENSNIFSDHIYQILLSSAVLSMFCIPFLYYFGEKISSNKRFKKAIEFDEPEIQKLHNHTIIAGFGVNGQNISRTLKLLGLPFNIIDLNRTTVKKYKASGFPIHYGDLDRKENLIAMGIQNAALLVIAISDTDASKRAIKLARSLNKDIKIIARSNYLADVEPMYKLGSNLVLSQDMETSLIFLFHILKFYNLPDHIIRLQTNILRKEHYKFFTKDEFDDKWKISSFDDLEKDNEMFFISSSSRLIGKSIEEFDPVKSNLIKIIGIIRNDVVHAENLNEIVLEQFDTLIFFGNHLNIQKAVNWFEQQN